MKKCKAVNSNFFGRRALQINIILENRSTKLDMWSNLDVLKVSFFTLLFNLTKCSAENWDGDTLLRLPYLLLLIYCFSLSSLFLRRVMNIYIPPINSPFSLESPRFQRIRCRWRDPVMEEVLGPVQRTHDTSSTGVGYRVCMYGTVRWCS